MSVSLSPLFNSWQGFGTNGLPLNAGILNTYAAGTSTPQVAYFNSSGGAYATSITLGADGRLPNGGEMWLTDGQSYKFVLTDSASNVIATYDNITASKTLYDFNVFVSGKPTASQYLLRIPVQRALTFNANLVSATGSSAYASASATATASYTLTVAKNGVGFGTIVYALGSSTGTITAATPPNFAAGDILSIQAPASPDSTLADIGISFNATLL